MVMFEMLTYQGCQNENLDQQDTQAPPISGADKQTIGRPWDYQDKFDPTLFFTSTATFSWPSSGIVAEICNV